MREYVVISCLSIWIFPFEGVSSPAIILSRVVFPHPEGPKRAKNSFF